MTKKRRIAIISFGIFLGFMAVCTIVAKGIYTSGLSKVTVIKPERRSISHEIKANGMVKQGNEYGIYVEEGLRIATVMVRSGDFFECGDPLFQIDVDDLKDLIEKKELEMKKTEIQQAENNKTSNNEKKKKQLALARAKEDNETVLRDADLKINRARDNLKKAQDELSEYGKYISEGAVSSGDAADSKLSQLKQAVLECNHAVENALLAKEAALTASQRAIEDAENTAKETYTAAKEVYQLEKEYQQKVIEELKEVLENAGWIYAPNTGRIMEQRITTGDRTTDSPCLTYAFDNGERIVDAVLSKDDGSYVVMGDEFKLECTLASGTVISDSSKVEYIKTGINDVTVRMRVENEEIKIGQNVKLSITKQSDIFENCIAAESLLEDGNGLKYVYIVEQQEGIMGLEWRVRRINVKVLDRNDTAVAIESTVINSFYQIIKTSTKDIYEGSIVRVLD